MSVDDGLATGLWCDPEQGLVPRMDALLAQRQWHVARTVVLLPYGPLMAVARQAWAWCAAQGGGQGAGGAGGGQAAFMPRFETTHSWARELGGFVAGAHDITFDMARDLVTAETLLAGAGVGSERLALAGRLVEMALELAPLAAAQLPQDRQAWARRIGVVAEAGAQSEWFRLESLLVGVAIAWTSTSAYATDLLLQEAGQGRVDGLIVLEGFLAEPLTQRLLALWGERAVRLPLQPLDPLASSVAALHLATDPEDEAERVVACIWRHLSESRTPVALVATDRALTRRIGAQLTALGIVRHDEPGWKLSTTRAAATLMAALLACAHDAASDQVLDWLKSDAHSAIDGDASPVDMAPPSPPSPQGLQALEARLRREGLHDWRGWCGRMARSEQPGDAALQDLTLTIEARRGLLLRARPLPEWLLALRELLQGGGQWEALLADPAGAHVISALWLDQDDADLGGVRRSLSEFTAWVRDVLEADSFVPPIEGPPQVLVLPLHQLPGRSFAALVIPGCDDRRLQAAPEPAGPWSAAQRELLGLPSRGTLQAAQRGAWAAALQHPFVDLLWRGADAGGEPVRPSPLVQTLLLDGRATFAADPRALREVPQRPTPRPLPVGALLPLATLSASAYEDLRRCPYRFFALRQLGLRSADEIDAEVDKRDFGNWLHAVFGHFHQALKTPPTGDPATRLALMAAAADSATREFGLSEAEFLPFSAAWPAVRDGYLQWLAGHEAAGHVFVESERWREQSLGSIRLVGRLDRIDRIDRMGDGQRLVIDYKTEPLATTKDRVKDPAEDTQLAFYAALMDDDSPRAAYVNVGEKSSGTNTVEQPDVVAARDALVAGLMSDIQRINAGAVLPALGEGVVCEHCAARGLCRRDFWTGGASRLATADASPPPGEGARLALGRPGGGGTSSSSRTGA